MAGTTADHKAAARTADRRPVPTARKAQKPTFHQPAILRLFRISNVCGRRINPTKINRAGRRSATGRWAGSRRDAISTDRGSKPAKGLNPKSRRRAVEGRPTAWQGRDSLRRVAEHRAEGTRRCMTRRGEWNLAATPGCTDRSRAAHSPRLHRTRPHERSSDRACDTMFTFSRRTCAASNCERMCPTQSDNQRVAPSFHHKRKTARAAPHPIGLASARGG